jgi:restriction endonuclease S subunit
MKDNFTSTIPKELIPYKLPNNWKWFLWSDLISNYQQGMIRSNSQLGKGNAEYLKMGDLDSSGRANFSSLAKAEASQNEIEEFLLKEGDFLINVRNSKELVGKTCVIENINNRTVLFNHMLVRMDHGSVELNYYINAFLNIPSSKKMLDRIKQGTTTVIALYQRDLNKLPISLPDSNTFESIVKFYKSINAKIELNNRINTELEAMAKTLYDYWFVQFDFPNEEGKPYKSSGGKMVWDEKLKREIPEGWEVKLVNDLLSKETPAKKIPSSEYLEEGLFPIIDQSTDFIAGYTNDQKCIIDCNVPRIVFGDHTRILKLINFDFARGADGTQVLLTNDKRNPQHLFYHSLLKIDLSNYGYARHFKFLKDSKIILPKEDIANKYEVIVTSFFENVKSNFLQNKQLASLRDWLLPMLMNGQVSVGDVEEQLGMVAEQREEYK